MPKSDGNYIQYNVRLNLNNPKHMRIYRTLEGLDSKVDGSKNQYIIEALIQRITGHASDDFQNIDKFITKSEFEKNLREMKESIMLEMFQYLNRNKETKNNNVESELVQDKTLEELSVMFSQGNFE